MLLLLEKLKQKEQKELTKDNILVTKVMDQNNNISVDKLRMSFEAETKKKYSRYHLKNILKRNNYRYKIPRFNQLYVNLAKNITSRYNYAKSFIKMAEDARF